MHEKLISDANKPKGTITNFTINHRDEMLKSLLILLIFFRFINSPNQAIVQLKNATRQKCPLDDHCCHKHVETRRTKSILFEKHHEICESNEDHHMNVLKVCQITKSKGQTKFLHIFERTVKIITFLHFARPKISQVFSFIIVF